MERVGSDSREGRRVRIRLQLYQKQDFARLGRLGEMGEEGEEVRTPGLERRQASNRDAVVERYRVLLQESGRNCCDYAKKNKDDAQSHISRGNCLHPKKEKKEKNRRKMIYVRRNVVEGKSGGSDALPGRKVGTGPGLHRRMARR